MTNRRRGPKGEGARRAISAHRTQHLFDCWAQVSERLRSAKRLALFLDFDGTLAPFRVRPEAVSLSDSTRRALRRLVRQPRVRLFILSGRRRADVKNRVRVAGISYLGLHGWEGPTTAAPNGLTSRLLRQAKRQLQHSLAGLRGVWVEQKGAIFAVHCRGTTVRAARHAGSLVSQVVKPFKPYLRVLSGNKVWEVVPLELEGKGAAARALLRQMPSATLPIYIGDDTTDEAAFGALPRGITVCVGARRPTQAGFALRGPQEVRRFLEKVDREVRESH